jgi:hypothetical protein
MKLARADCVTCFFDDGAQDAIHAWRLSALNLSYSSPNFLSCDGCVKIRLVNVMRFEAIEMEVY